MITGDLKKKIMQLALEHRSRIWAFLMGLSKDPNVAEDLFQSTYLVICEKWQQFEPGTNFPAWALKIARYEYLKSVDPSRHPLVTLEMDALECALEAVESPSTSPCDGLSCREVARRLRVSLNSLYSRLSRVRDALRECVERRLGIDGETA